MVFSQNPNMQCLTEGFHVREGAWLPADVNLCHAVRQEISLFKHKPILLMIPMKFRQSSSLHSVMFADAAAAAHFSRAVSDQTPEDGNTEETDGEDVPLLK